MQSLMDQVTEWMGDMSQKEMEETGGEIKRFWYRFPGALGSAVGEYTGTEDSLRKHLDQEVLTAWCGTKARPSSVAVYVVPYVGKGHKMDRDNEFTHISFTGRDILSVEVSLHKAMAFVRDAIQAAELLSNDERFKDPTAAMLIFQLKQKLKAGDLSAAVWRLKGLMRIMEEDKS